jgi:calcineurin-like phosphoesterase family protein
MSRVWLMSDLHLGHNSICKYRKTFSSAEEHHNTLFENLASTVGKKDSLILLGDVAFTSEWNAKIKTISCAHKMLIMGNHDRDKVSILELADTYDNKVYSLLSKKNFWLSHAPIHPDEIRNRRGVLHGHTHQYCVSDGRYVNLSVEQTDYKPILWDDAVDRIYCPTPQEETIWTT